MATKNMMRMSGANGVEVVIGGAVAWTGRAVYVTTDGFVGVREGKRVDEVRAELVRFTRL